MKLSLETKWRKVFAIFPERVEDHLVWFSFFWVHDDGVFRKTSLNPPEYTNPDKLRIKVLEERLANIKILDEKAFANWKAREKMLADDRGHWVTRALKVEAALKKLDTNNVD